MYQWPTICIACSNTTNTFADTVLEQAYSNLDRVLASWGNMVCTSWICIRLCNLSFFTQKIPTCYSERSFCNWNLLFSCTFSNDSYISCIEWITSEMLSGEMLFIEIYIDYQCMNQCHCFIILLNAGGFDCNSWIVLILCNITFSTRVSKGSVHFVVIKLWQHFWEAEERKLVIKVQCC